MAITQLQRTQTVSGTVTIRAEASSANWISSATMAANTPLTIFTPASNSGGAIILSMDSIDHVSGAQTFLAKTSAPAGLTDGEIMAISNTNYGANTMAHISARGSPQFVAAGKGLYFISNAASTSGGWGRGCRYVLL